MVIHSPPPKKPILLSMNDSLVSFLDCCLNRSPASLMAFTFPPRWPDGPQLASPVCFVAGFLYQDPNQEHPLHLDIMSLNSLLFDRQSTPLLFFFFFKGFNFLRRSSFLRDKRFFSLFLHDGIEFISVTFVVNWTLNSRHV